MLRNNKYEQSGGQSSINLQGENVHYHGLTYSDAKEIAQDVFEKNFRELTTVAGDIATQRANEVREQMMTKLKQVEEKALDSFQDPDFQYQIFNVQKEYARSGDKNLAEMLTDLLVERAKEPNRTLKQILLNESMSVLPKLTSAQIDILTCIFIVKLIQDNEVTTLDMLKKLFTQFYEALPIEESEVKLTSNYLHLQYAGCGNISVTGVQSFAKVYSNIYPELFPTESEFTNIIKELNPKVEVVAKLWNDSPLRGFTLTSVGIAIAHSNACRLLGINPDLEIWIS